ncbi:acetylcholine receptor subunit beta-type acr-2-like [Lycorma delicatula]|uniref:acetylcholine receptor subunit beta-type acr-2-like n=1 Tax=Lycorma delicatula TaxID=130591 RepID=UPI003F515E24
MHFFCVLLLFFTVLHGCLSHSHSIKKLKSKLFMNYDKGTSPFNKNGSISIFIWIISSSLEMHGGGLNGRIAITMMWTDPRLSWTPSEYEDVSTIHIDTNDVWKPEVIPVFDHRFQGPSFHSVESIRREFLSLDGEVTVADCIDFVTYCESNEEKWPYDTQICTLKFGSKTSSGIIMSTVTAEGIKKFFDWKFLKRNQYWDVVDAEESLKNTTGTLNQVLELKLTFKRNGFIYVIIFLVPEITVIFTTLVLLWVKAENPHRLVLLGVFVCLQSHILRVIGDLVPHSGEKPPLVSFFVCISLGITVLCIIETIIIRIILRANLCPLWLQNTMNKFWSINIFEGLQKSGIKKIQLLQESDEEIRDTNTLQNLNEVKKVENTEAAELFIDFITFILVMLTYAVITFKFFM